MPDAPRKFRLNQRQPRDTRRTAAERGYDHAWNQFAKRYKQQYPLCRNCLSKGDVKPSQIVDHIIPLHVRPDLKYEDSNLQPLCTACNTAKGKEDAKKYGANR